MVLFFLSHAGGSARSYCTFKRFLPKSLTVIPMEAAGRGSRGDEPLFHEISACCADLLARHRDVIAQGDYAFFGHSMGTMLACELTRQILAAGLPAPKHVFLSGRCAADAEISCFPNIDDATDDEIASLFFEKSLFPKPTQETEQLMTMLKRILCADVRMVDRVRYTPQDVTFPCDLTVLYGEEDTFLHGCDMRAWQRFTKGDCDVHSFAGGHFYYQQNLEPICRLISKHLGVS